MGLSKEQIRQKKESFLELLKEKKGLVTLTCQDLHIDKKTYCRWLERDPDFAAEVQKIKDGVNEYVVGRLMNLVEQGVPSAIYFYLKCKAGWRETQKVEIQNANDIDVKAALEQIKQSTGKGKRNHQVKWKED